ncbi:MAG: hypothetical protein Kow0070_30250 [Anaerolineales bacterium]
MNTDFDEKRDEITLLEFRTRLKSNLVHLWLEHEFRNTVLERAKYTKLFNSSCDPSPDVCFSPQITQIFTDL